MLVLPFNGLFFACFEIEKRNVINKLCEVIRTKSKNAKEIMFRWNNPPENKYRAQLWANHKLGDSNWIFWNTFFYILDDNKLFMTLGNIAIALGCFVLPNFL